jgi:hypothetical protein
VRVGRSRYEVTLDFACADPEMDVATAVSRLSLAPAVERELVAQLRQAHLEWQVQQAMALPDATGGRLADGSWAYAGHRRVRDGARVALLTVPGLLRFDIHGRGDSFSFHVRNLSHGELPPTVHESGPRPAPRRHGRPLTEYQLHARLPSGVRVRLVVHVSPYTGALEGAHSVVALIDES